MASTNPDWLQHDLDGDVWIEYYTSQSDPDLLYLFAVSPHPTGSMTLTGADGAPLAITVNSREHQPEHYEGATTAIPVNSTLLVLTVRPA